MMNEATGYWDEEELSGMDQFSFEKYLNDMDRHWVDIRCYQSDLVGEGEDKEYEGRRWWIQ